MDQTESPRLGRKYAKIYHELRQKLLNGEYREGERLPTEMELSERYGVSRPTVTKALNELMQEGLLSRRIGSGSYAHPPKSNIRNRLFGLLIPGLGRGEIFEPICASVASSAERHNFSLLWSGFDQDARMHPLASEAIARRYIDTGAAGVFFEPLELWPGFEEVNLRVVRMLEEATMPVVLVDADYLHFPERSRFDLVCLDNVRAGYTAARHLLREGVHRIDFLCRPHSADSIRQRIGGYRLALAEGGLVPDPSWLHVGYPEDATFVRELLSDGAPLNLVCGNDETAASLMVTLEELSVPVPDAIRIVGFDDVHYSKRLRVPLTTVRQPCEEIGRLAMETMLWRLEHPDRPARTVLASGTLVVRASCGYG